jgi:hypothetical protein
VAPGAATLLRDCDPDGGGMTITGVEVGIHGEIHPRPTSLSGRGGKRLGAGLVALVDFRLASPAILARAPAEGSFTRLSATIDGYVFLEAGKSASPIATACLHRHEEPGSMAYRDPGPSLCTASQSVVLVEPPRAAVCAREVTLIRGVLRSGG